MTSVSDLFALQELDLVLASDRAELGDIESRLGETDELREARRLVDERKQELRAAEKRAKEAEFEADEQRRRIEPVEHKLYRGGITNPKELEDLQRDLESLQRRRAELDERALQALDELDAAQRALEEAEQARREVAGQFDADQEALAGRRAELDREMADLEARRAEQLQRVDGELLSFYERIGPRRGGRAVAKVEGGACGGCRISLPVNVLQRARSGSGIVQCSSCERILYVT